MSNLDLTLAANTLETSGKKMLDHARKLRDEIGPQTKSLGTAE